MNSWARALSGDPAGALLNFRNYVGNLIESEQSATIWERYEPSISDMRKYFGRNWEWAYSLCHGWGAGAVPLTTRFLLGIESIKPGFKTINIAPCSGLDWSFNATIPTPYGGIQVNKKTRMEKSYIKFPKA